MVGNVEETGLEAVIRGVGAYVSNAGKITASNTAIQRSLGTVVAAAGRFQKVLQTAMKVGALAAVAGLAASIKVFTDFDSAMTESIAIMGDVSAAMREDMERAARDVAKTTTFSMKEAAESYFFLASAGLSAAQSIAAMPKVAAFAQAGMFNMATATDLLTDAQSALGLTVDDTAQNIENMVRISDVLVKANTASNATVQQFAESLTNEAAAALKTVNKDIEEGVAVLAAFADQGIKGQVAGTSFARVMRLVGSAAVNNKEAMEALNIEVFNADESWRNLADIIEDLENALLPMTDAARIAALETLGFSARIQGVILPLLGTSQAIRDYEKSFRSATGFTEDVAEKQLTSLGAQFSLLRSGIEDLLFTIGKALEPQLRSLVATIRDDLIPWVEDRLPSAIEKVEEFFKDWQPVLKQTADDIKTLGGAVKAFGDYITGNQATIVAAIGAIGLAFAWVLPGPTGIIFGLGAVAAAIVILRTDVEDLSPALLELQRAALETTIALSKFVIVGSAAGAVVAALTGHIFVAAGLIAAMGAAALAADFAADRLNELDTAILRVSESANTTTRTLKGLAEALAKGDAEFIRVQSTMGNYTFLMNRAAASSEAVRLAWEEIAAQGPDTALAFEVIAQAAIDAGRPLREFTNQMLMTMAVMNEIARQWVSFRGAGMMPPGLQATLDRLAAIRRFLAGGGAAPPGGVGDGGALDGDGLSGAVEEAMDVAAEAWRRGAEKWMEALAQGIRDGTVDVIDAIEFLERDMIDAARSIVDALLFEQLKMQEQWRVLADIISRGFATLADAARLFELGATEAALEVLRSLVGRPTALAEAIERARREALEPIFPTLSAQQGAFIPAGQTVQAQLHGPEIVVPLGSNTMALRALTQALQGVPSSAGAAGFRNFGSISLFASERDSQIMRNITHALGVA